MIAASNPAEHDINMSIQGRIHQMVSGYHDIKTYFRHYIFRGQWVERLNINRKKMKKTNLC